MYENYINVYIVNIQNINILELLNKKIKEKKLYPIYFLKYNISMHAIAIIHLHYKNYLLTCVSITLLLMRVCL